MSEVVVTGAAGFIGRWVVKELLDRGYNVVGIDDFSGGTPENVAEFDDDPSFEFVKGNVRDRELIEEYVASTTDAVIHLAARIDVQESLDDPQSHFDANVVGTQVVLEACRKADTRLSLMGTCMVYDVAGDDAIDETHPVKPASPYAGSKLAAENLAESYYHGYDLPVTVLRPFNTYGPYQRSNLSGGVVSIFTSRDLNDEPLFVFGDGTQTRDLLYVTDCAEFAVEATFSNAAVGEVINAGTGSDIAIKDLANLIATGDNDVKFREHRHPQSEIQRLCCDPTKAEEMLGWTPQVSLEEGVSRLRNWLQTEPQVETEQ